jgi:DNA-binding transcriptional MerR regulator
LATHYGVVVTDETPGAADGDPGAAAEGFVIEELSRRTGLTVRSLRSYQTRKLLPPPAVRGRTGYYDERHVARIELIKDLQSQGLKLTSIARMLDEQSASDADLLRFTRTVSSLYGERPESLTSVGELAERFGVGDDAGAVLGRAMDLGLLRDLGDGTVEEVNPRLLAAGDRAMELLDLDVSELLDTIEQLRRHADAVATLYLDLFLERVWTPFLRAGQPPERWGEVEDALRDVRGLATEALVGAFELVMATRVTDVLDQQLARPASKGRRRRSRDG